MNVNEEAMPPEKNLQDKIRISGRRKKSCKNSESTSGRTNSRKNL